VIEQFDFGCTRIDHLKWLTAVTAGMSSLPTLGLLVRSFFGVTRVASPRILCE